MLLVSEEDKVWLQSLQWVGRNGRRFVWYYREYGDRKSHILSRAIANRMGLNIEGMQIDHINRDVNDNRRENLRCATNSQNRANSVNGNKTGFKGVKFRKPRNIGNRKRHSDYKPRWSAQITIDGKKHWLGDFDTPEEAHNEYMLFAQMFHKEFANNGKE
jgi:hypothetical protein